MAWTKTWDAGQRRPSLRRLDPYHFDIGVVRVIDREPPGFVEIGRVDTKLANRRVGLVANDLVLEVDDKGPEHSTVSVTAAVVGKTDSISHR